MRQRGLVFEIMLPKMNGCEQKVVGTFRNC